MRRRVPSAAKALIALTAAGLLLSGCHYYRPYHGGPYYAAPGDGYSHHHGKGKKYRQGNRRHGHRGPY
ncbi:MAG: hypothetical protein RH942_04345 [Kiloniellaceae bacterium]